jgi:hypothetical protein
MHKYKSVRIRGSEAEYIQKIADENGENFLEALYRIIHAHKYGIGATSNQTQSEPMAKKESTPEPTTDTDFDLDAFA